jgi:hypothetical protein
MNGFPLLSTIYLLPLLAVIVILGMNLLWGLAGGLKGPAEKAPAGADKATWLPRAGC